MLVVDAESARRASIHERDTVGSIYINVYIKILILLFSNRNIISSSFADLHIQIFTSLSLLVILPSYLAVDQ